MDRDSDNFTYSNGVLATVSGGKWTQPTATQDILVVSNRVSGENADDVSIAIITTWSGDNEDQWNQIVLTTVGVASGICLRGDGVDDAFLVETNGTNWDVYKWVAGTFTAINGVAQVASNGDTMYFEIQGNAIISKRNGNTVNNFSDSSLASGKPGLYAYNTSIAMDTWTAGDFITVTAAMTGTGIGGITEADIVSGGKVVTVTITGDTLIPA